MFMNEQSRQGCAWFEVLLDVSYNMAEGGHIDIFIQNRNGFTHSYDSLLS